MSSKETTVDVNDLLPQLKSISTPTVDLKKLGIGEGLVELDGLYTLIFGHPEPQISFHWDDKILSVKRTSNGEVLATFKMQLP